MQRKILKIVILAVCGCFLLISTSFAFLYDVNILDKKAIKALSDDKLIDTYIDVMVEIRASQTFHETSGFSNVREYEKYKELIKYRVYLEMELKSRELEAPDVKL